MNGKKDDTMEVFCTKKLRYVKDENLNKKCRKYKYDPYERIPVSKPKLKKYDSKDFLIE
jgi:hypothetical protein